MSIYRKKKDVSKHLPRAFYLFGIEVDFEAIQFSYFFGVFKELTAQLLHTENKMPVVNF